MNSTILLAAEQIEDPLPQTSEVRCNKVVTIRSILVEKVITQLKPEALESLIEKVCLTFQLAE